MKYAAIKDGQLTSRATERNEIKIKGVPRPASLTDDQLAQMGVYPLVYADLPEGHVVQAESWLVDGGRAFQTVLDVSTPESRANDAQAQRASEIAAFIDAYSIPISQLAGLLAVFDLAIPITLAEATGIIYAQSKADPTKTADGVLAMSIYNELRRVMSDDDIAAAWSYIKERV